MTRDSIDLFTHAQAFFQECQRVSDFLERRVVPLASGAADASPTPEGETYLGLLLRVRAWMKTLDRLNNPMDFQAVSVASRSLCETSIDLVLLNADPAHGPAKFRAWEDSAKLKAAEKVRDYFGSNGTPPTPEFVPQIDFIARESSRVIGLRVAFWGGRHPQRWTGQDLGRDAKAADTHFAAGDFGRFYATRYQHICWDTHGSGLVTMRSVAASNLPALGALAYRECAHFAMIAAECALAHWGLWTAAMAVEFDDFRAANLFHTYEAMRG